MYIHENNVISLFHVLNWTNTWLSIGARWVVKTQRLRVHILLCFDTELFTKQEPMEWGVQKSQPNFLLGKHFVITCYHWTNQWTNPCLVLMFLYSLFIIKWQCFGPRSQHDRSHLITWHMGTWHGNCPHTHTCHCVNYHCQYFNEEKCS